MAVYSHVVVVKKKKSTITMFHLLKSFVNNTHDLYSKSVANKI